MGTEDRQAPGELRPKASRLTPDQKIALSDKLRAMSPRWEGDSAELIREDRDSGRGQAS